MTLGSGAGSKAGLSSPAISTSLRYKAPTRRFLKDAAQKCRRRWQAALWECVPGACVPPPLCARPCGGCRRSRPPPGSSSCAVRPCGAE
ncbi:MAG: hypothetical protein MZV64_02160 [Ignavibacteriales bacterium]|nr:hypothetical protein [Ignavibacteriales bacterium]